MIFYKLIEPNLLEFGDLSNIVKMIPENEYKLQLQVYSEQEDNASPKHYSFEEWNKKRIKQKILYYIAYEDSKLVGSISFFLNPQTCYSYYDVESKNAFHISQLFIDEEYRGKGIGKKLIYLVEKYSLDYGLYSIDLQTSYTNYTAQSVYKSLDYSIKFGVLSIDTYPISIAIKPANSLYKLDQKLDSIVNSSLRNLINYYDNGFTFTELKANFLMNLSRHIFGIFIFDDNNYGIWSIWNYPVHKSLRLFELIGDNIELMINSSIAYANKVNIDNVSIIARTGDINPLINIGFKGKMLHLSKNLKVKGV